MHKPQAVVRTIAGQVVLDDPQAVEVIRAVSKHNCKDTLELNGDRVAHFVRRVAELGKTGADVAIVIIHVDMEGGFGAVMADSLMPGYNWQDIRDRGEVPFARGLATRDGIQEALNVFDSDAAKDLRDMPGLAIVVFDHGVAAVFAVDDIIK